MHSESVQYSDGITSLAGFLTLDTSKAGQRPGVLVVHGGAGLDDHARQRARSFAELGFVALACDMYGAGGDRQRVMTSIVELRDDPEKLCQRAQAALDLLASHPKVNGRLAAVGYCFGGMTVLQLARSGTALLGVVSVHGTLKTTRPAQPSKLKAKILVCHGALDPHVPMTDVNTFIEEMNSAAADWELIVYGGAMHGFTYESGPQTKMPGVAYNAQADARSAIAIREFITELFGSPIMEAPNAT